MESTEASSTEVLQEQLLDEGTQDELRESVTGYLEEEVGTNVAYSSVA